MEICNCTKAMWLLAIITLAVGLISIPVLPIILLIDYAIGTFLFLYHIGIFMGAPSALYDPTDDVGKGRGIFNAKTKIH